MDSHEAKMVVMLYTIDVRRGERNAIEHDDPYSGEEVEHYSFASRRLYGDHKPDIEFVGLPLESAMSLLVLDYDFDYVGPFGENGYLFVRKFRESDESPYHETKK